MTYIKTDWATYKCDDKNNDSSRMWYEFKEKQQQQNKTKQKYVCVHIWMVGSFVHSFARLHEMQFNRVKWEWRQRHVSHVLVISSTFSFIIVTQFQRPNWVIESPECVIFGSLLKHVSYHRTGIWFDSILILFE